MFVLCVRLDMSWILLRVTTCVIVPYANFNYPLVFFSSSLPFLSLLFSSLFPSLPSYLSPSLPVFIPLFFPFLTSVHYTIESFISFLYNFLLLYFTLLVPIYYLAHFCFFLSTNTLIYLIYLYMIL